MQERLPSQLVEAICNVTAEQLSPEPVRTAVMECTDPDESKRSAALKARMEQRGDGVDDSPADTDDVSTAKNSSRTLCTDWPDLSGALDSGGAFRGAASPLTAFGPTCSHAVPVARLVPTGLLSFSVDPHIQGRGAKKRTQRARRLLGIPTFVRRERHLAISLGSESAVAFLNRVSLRRLRLRWWCAGVLDKE